MCIRVCKADYNLFLHLAAEASCAASLRTAKAVVREAGDSVSPALISLANKSESHAESAFHSTLQEQGLALEVPLTELHIDSRQSFEVLLMSDWLKLILILVPMWCVCVCVPDL